MSACRPTKSSASEEVAEVEEALKPALLALFLFLVIPRIIEDRSGSASAFEQAELIRF